MKPKSFVSKIATVRFLGNLWDRIPCEFSTKTTLKVEVEATVFQTCIKMLKASTGEDFKIYTPVYRMSWYVFSWLVLVGVETLAVKTLFDSTNEHNGVK